MLPLERPGFPSIFLEEPHDSEVCATLLHSALSSTDPAVLHHWKTGAPSFPPSSLPVSLTILVSFVSTQRIHPTLWPLGYLTSSTQTTTSLPLSSISTWLLATEGMVIPCQSFISESIIQDLGPLVQHSHLLLFTALGCKRPSCLTKFPAQVTSLIPVDDS